MSWRVARSLDTLLAEVNAEAPNRSKASDGSIGDTSHGARASDHNPNSAGVVRARDFTHDPAGGLNCDDLLDDHLVPLLGKHPALGSGAYFIWNRAIISADRLSEGWRTYTGSNPHDHHCHVSVATSAAGYDSTTPWLEETDSMAQHTDQLNRIEAAALAAVTAAEKTKARVDKMGTNLKADRVNDKALTKALREIGADVDKVLARVAELDDEQP